jgi:hypothetical protein
MPRFKPRYTNLLTLPNDHVVEIAYERDQAVYGVGDYRADVTRGYRSRLWFWRVWQVAHRDIMCGHARGRENAMGQALDALRREAGIEQVVTGSTSAVGPR